MKAKEQETLRESNFGLQKKKIIPYFWKVKQRFTKKTTTKLKGNMLNYQLISLF